MSRQTTLSEDCAKVYLSAMGGFDMRDLQAAVEKLAKEPRREYAPAFPELGNLIASVEEAASKRKAASLGKFKACGECHDGMILTTVRGLDGRPERACAECSCRIAWNSTRQEAAIQA